MPASTSISQPQTSISGGDGRNDGSSSSSVLWQALARHVECVHAFTHICIKDVTLFALTATTAVVTFAKMPHSASIRQIADQKFERQDGQLLEE